MVFGLSVLLSYILSFITDERWLQEDIQHLTLNQHTLKHFEQWNLLQSISDLRRGVLLQE